MTNPSDHGGKGKKKPRKKLNTSRPERQSKKKIAPKKKSKRATLKRTSRSESTTATRLLVAAPTKATSDRRLRADQVLQIIGDCIFKTTGSNAKVELSNTLQFYRFDNSDQITTFIANVTGNTNIGVPKYKFSLDKNALNGISKTSKISDVSTRIQNSAVPV